MGPFSGYAVNREPMLKVIERHREMRLQTRIRARAARPACARRARRGTTRSSSAQSAGYRNSQATVIAPTGTIAFMMDCDTTGIEPDIALVKYKKLVGGGMLKIVNGTVPRALKRLGYDSREIQEIVEYLDEHETDRGRAASGRRASGGLRLRLQAARRLAHDSLPGPSQDDGRGAAVHLGRDLEDHQHAGRSRRSTRSPRPI